MFRVLAPLALAAAVAIGRAPPSGAETKPMTFEDHAGLWCGHLPCSFIFGRGRITADTPRALADFIRGTGYASGGSDVAVVISSPGGDLSGAVETGKLIRAKRFKTYIGTVTCDAGEPLCELAPGECHGACVYMFAGGTRRKVHEASAFSVRRISADDVRGFLAQEKDQGTLTKTRRAGANKRRLTALLWRYLKSMTVSPQLLGVVASAPPGGRLSLGPKHLRALNVTTHVIEVPTQWRLAGEGRNSRLIATVSVFETGGFERVSYSATLSCSKTQRGRVLVHFAETGSRITRDYDIDFLRPFAKYGVHSLGLGDDRWMSETVERRFSDLHKSGHTLGFSFYLLPPEVMTIAGAREFRLRIGMPHYLDGGIGTRFELDQARGLLITLLRNCERG